MARRGFTPVHDRGRVLGDLAVCIADGGRVLSDLAALRDQPELYGPVASDPTAWRALDAIGEKQRQHIATARAKTRRRVWALISDRHGRIPPSKVADVDLGKTVVIRLDATIQIAHSGKEGAAGTFKGAPTATTRCAHGATTPAKPSRCCCARAMPVPTLPPTTSPC